MHIQVITSCTSQKACTHPLALTVDDILGGKGALDQRLGDLASVALPAAELYRGQQHRRLMRGVRTIEARAEAGETVPTVDLRVVSAGFGLIRGDHPTPPYDATFAGLAKKKRRALADHLGIPAALAAALAEPADLHLVLLGDHYAEAACLTDLEFEHVAGPALVVASAKLARDLPSRPDLAVVEISRQDPARFGTNLIGLRGEIAGRLLVALADDPALLGRLLEPGFDLLSTLEARPKAADPSVDWVVNVPPTRPEAQRLRYFIPDWDDLVDLEYDFETETHKHGAGGWDYEVYAHQILDRPAYDGLLVSREVVRASRRKDAHLRSLEGHGGVHRYLRVPPSFPVMGDCGAFGYAKDEAPPYSTDDVLDYYERLGFDYGVSVDHLAALAPSKAARQDRYDLTLANAEAFLAEHRARDAAFTPVGAIQGWDRHSYREAARRLVAMGYRYIGVGGLVMTRTEEVLSILEAIHEVVPPAVGLHAFGLARPEATPDLVRLGVTSIDSASPLRKAWLDGAHNYWTPSGVTYAALRIPAPKTSWEPKDQNKGARLADEALAAVRGVDRGTTPVAEALQHLEALELHVVDVKRMAEAQKARDEGREPKPIVHKPMRDHYRLMLEDRPWQSCPCTVCQEAGVEVAIFRGNNRNRRRGFHNTRVFYGMVAAGVHGAPVRLVRALDAAPLPLFASA